VPAWRLIGGLAAGATALVTRAVVRRQHQGSAARAAGLHPAADLAHLPEALQRTALWCLSDGGFEQRVVRGTISRATGDIAVTAFDLETLRERRGEWAWLPVEPPFRIAGTVSVVACEIARDLPHVLLKRAGVGDELADDDRLQRLGHIAKSMRDGLGVARSYPSELPPTLPVTAAGDLPEHWRAYTKAPDALAALLDAGLRTALVQTTRRDLVVELLGPLVVVYPAAHAASGADALADLTETGLSLVDVVLAASASSDRL
jgi:hypothetical protein